MDESDLRQTFFITDDGYINLTLKVVTEDKVEREKLVSQLLSKLFKKEPLDSMDGLLVHQIYRYDQDRKTILKELKSDFIEYLDDIIKDIE